MKKDLIEIVTEERNYYVKGIYEEVKIELIKCSERGTWIEFYELTELFYLPQEEPNIDRILLKVGNIIAIHKLSEWSEES